MYISNQLQNLPKFTGNKINWNYNGNKTSVLYSYWSLNYSRLYQLHFRYTSASSKLPSILPLLGFIIKPLCENTFSTGAELAGIDKTGANSDFRQLYSTSVQISGGSKGALAKSSAPNSAPNKIQCAFLFDMS